MLSSHCISFENLVSELTFLPFPPSSSKTLYKYEQAKNYKTTPSHCFIIENKVLDQYLNENGIEPDRELQIDITDKTVEVLELDGEEFLDYSGHEKFLDTFLILKKCDLVTKFPIVESLNFDQTKNFANLTLQILNDVSDVQSSTLVAENDDPGKFSEESFEYSYDSDESSTSVSDQSTSIDRSDDESDDDDDEDDDDEDDFEEYDFSDEIPVEKVPRPLPKNKINFLEPLKPNTKAYIQDFISPTNIQLSTGHKFSYENCFKFDYKLDNNFIATNLFEILEEFHVEVVAVESLLNQNHGKGSKKMVYFDLKFVNIKKAKYRTVFECLVRESSLALDKPNDRILSLIDNFRGL